MMNVEKKNEKLVERTLMLLKIPFNNTLVDYFYYLEDALDLIEIAKEQKLESLELPVMVGGIETTIVLEAAKLEEYIKESYRISPIVPEEISQYLNDLTIVFRSQIDFPKLQGRNRELDKTWQNLSQSRRKNVFLVGPTDVGKTEIAYEICRQISDGSCPPDFEDKRMLLFDTKKLYRFLEDGPDDDELETEDLYGATGMAVSMAKFNYKKIIKSIRKFFEENKDKIVLFIEEAMYSLYDLSLMDLVFDVITDYNIPIIITALPDEYNEYFIENNRIAKYINLVEVREPELKNIRPMLERHIAFCETKYGIKMSNRMIKTAIYTERLNDTVSAVPGKIVNVIYKAFDEAKRLGKTKIDKECIFNCYDTHYEQYDDIDERNLINTAYHEVGHAVIDIVGNHDRYVECVSILPMMYWAGVTMPGVDYKKYCIHSLDYFIDLIAGDMGGRVAEEIFLNEKFNSGAVYDIKNATQLAKNAVLTLALNKDSKIAFNRALEFEDWMGLSDEEKKIANNEIQELLRKGYERAKEIITENKELVEIIVHKLLKEEILTRDEIERIYKQYKKSKNSNET